MIWFWILYLLIFAGFGAMIYAWFTPASATMTGLGGSATVGGIAGYVLGSYTYGEKYIEALILGTNQNGQILLVGLILFIAVMILNALSDLAKHRPIRLIH